MLAGLEAGESAESNTVKQSQSGNDRGDIDRKKVFKEATILERTARAEGDRARAERIATVEPSWAKAR
jgi:hypothetical protein